MFIRTVSILLSFWISCAAAKACEVALALTVDISGSVDRQEYALQMNGLAAALRDPTVADALVDAKAAVMLVQWTGTSRQVVSMPWRRITDLGQLEGMAVEVENTERRWRNFSTAIGEALEFAAAQFSEVGDCKRKVIDVSGDGYSNEGVNPLAVRARLDDEGFTVNALSIEGSADNLTDYFWNNVVTGQGAFVMTANSFDEYPERIRQKLIREVTKKVSSLDLPVFQ